MARAQARLAGRAAAESLGERLVDIADGIQRGVADGCKRDEPGAVDRLAKGFVGHAAAVRGELDGAGGHAPAVDDDDDLDGRG